MARRGIGIDEAAILLNVDVGVLKAFIDGNVLVDDVFSKILEKGTGISSGLWKTLQGNYDAYKSESPQLD